MTPLQKLELELAEEVELYEENVERLDDQWLYIFNLRLKVEQLRKI